MLRPPSCLRHCGWDGAPSPPDISPPTTAPRSTRRALRCKPWGVGQATLVWSDCSAHWDNSQGRLFLAGNPSLAGFRGTGRMVLLAPKRGRWFPVASEHRTGPLSSEDGTTTFASSDTRGHWYACLAAQGAGHERLAGAAAGGAISQAAIQGTACTWHFPAFFKNSANGSTPAFRPRVLAHSAPNGLLDGHIFTDGSSSCSGALRPAGWAAVAVDDLGNLKAAAHGAVPVDVFCEQTSRDGEDYAAAMEGSITMDPLTLHIDCVGIATANRPKGNVWSRLLWSHDEVTAVNVKGHATEADAQAGRSTLVFRRGNKISQTRSQKKAPTHTSRPCSWPKLFWPRGWRDTLATSWPRTRMRRVRARANRKREDALVVPAAGSASDWLALFTREIFARQSTRPTLFQETLPASSSSLSFANSELAFSSTVATPGRSKEFDDHPEAVLGRQVCGPTISKELRSRPHARGLLSWAEPATERDKENDNERESWSNGRDALLAAYGVDDKVLAVLACKAARAAPSHQTPQA